MSLKSIKANYTKLLKTFSDAGVTITESQKETLDNFMLAIESKINKTRDDAIRATRRIVEDKCEKEYREVFESIRKHNEEMNSIAGKVQNKVSEINESKKISEAVDAFLDKYVEEVLPKKTLVDYARMEKLERIHESLKDMLQVNDMALEGKKVELEGKLVKESCELKEKCKDFEKKINEDEEKMKEMSKQIEEAKAKEFVSNKTKDLPIEESEKIQKKVQGMTVDDLEKNFQKILEDVQSEIEDEKAQSNDEVNLEEAVKSILEEKDSSEGSENDSDKTICNKDKEGTDVDSDSQKDIVTETDEDDEPESVPVNESMMRLWIDTLNRITPQK